MTTVVHPIRFDDFYQEYIVQLSAQDRPSTYIAYCRTEAQFATEDFPRRYVNHQTFQSTCSRVRKRKQKNNISV